MSKFAQPFLFRICMLCAYTRPRCQVSVYRTNGPLVEDLFDSNNFFREHNFRDIYLVIGYCFVKI